MGTPTITLIVIITKKVVTPQLFICMTGGVFSYSYTALLQVQI